MNRTRIAQILAGLVAVFLGFLAVRYTFTPDALSSLNQLTPEDAFGRSNIRAMGAPLLALAILTGLGAATKNFFLLIPAPIYFLAVIFTRIVSILTDGGDPAITRSIILAVVLFVLTEISAQLIKRANTQENTDV